MVSAWSWWLHVQPSEVVLALRQLDFHLFQTMNSAFSQSAVSPNDVSCELQMKTLWWRYHIPTLFQMAHGQNENTKFSCVTVVDLDIPAPVGFLLCRQVFWIHLSYFITVVKHWTHIPQSCTMALHTLLCMNKSATGTYCLWEQDRKFGNSRQSEEEIKI